MANIREYCFMSRKIRAAVVGYGNMRKYVVEVLECAPDLEVADVVSRGASNVPAELRSYEVVTSFPVRYAHQQPRT